VMEIPVGKYGTEIGRPEEIDAVGDLFGLDQRVGKRRSKRRACTCTFARQPFPMEHRVTSVGR
jgi:hypothetical protein